MRIIRHIIFTFFLIARTQIACAETLDLATAQLSQVSGQIHSLQQTIAQNQEQQTNLEFQLKTAELAIGKFSEQIAHLKEMLSQQQQILTELNATQQATLANLKSQNNALAQQMRAAYQLGVQNRLKILINQQDLNAANRHLVYYKALNQARAKLITHIQQNLALLAKTIRATKAHQQTLKKLIAEEQRQHDQQHHTLLLRQQLIAKLGLQTQSKQQQIELLVTNQQALQETVTRLKQKEITLSGQPFNELKNKLSWPVKGQLIAGFGSVLDVGEQHSNGVLIKTPMGTPVHAVYSGKVIFADWLRGFGLLVIINHGHQYMSLYARNEAIFAKAGQNVQTGEVIATTGNSGGYDKPGLYFEVRENGSPVNPKIWCR